MYSVLSQCYDALVGADYPAMAEFYKAIWRQFGQDPQIVLDLGCGTGNLLPFLEEGRQVIGVDISPEMLAIAREKAGPDTLLLCQDGNLCAGRCQCAARRAGGAADVLPRQLVFVGRGAVYL